MWLSPFRTRIPIVGFRCAALSQTTWNETQQGYETNDEDKNTSLPLPHPSWDDPVVPERQIRLKMLKSEGNSMDFQYDYRKRRVLHPPGKQNLPKESINPYDYSSDEEGNFTMPESVKCIIWSKEFPDLEPDKWTLYVNQLTKEEMWKLLYQRPKEFWDNRKKKRRRRTDPCFIHLLSNRPLWIQRDTTPDWARFNLKFLGTTAFYNI